MASLEPGSVHTIIITVICIIIARACNEHIQGQEMTKEDIEKTLPGPCTYHCTVFHHTHLTGAVFSFYQYYDNNNFNK